MSFFHTHYFKAEGINLYCHCGQVKKMYCGHQWVQHSLQRVTTYNGKVQDQEIVKCSKCGEFKNINRTYV